MRGRLLKKELLLAHYYEVLLVVRTTIRDDKEFSYITKDPTGDCDGILC
jgi:hypothetical protein